jgi:D-threo-aldose 1-dehydrogenase
VPLPAAALQFPPAHPAVAAVILGPRDVAEFEANLKLLRHSMAPALLADLGAEKLLHPDAPTPR